MYREYINCDLITFVSTYEGFGLPIIEGQSVGRAVITGNISSTTEIAGGSCCLVNPFNINSIASGITRVINDDSYRNRLIQDGFKNVHRFNSRNISLEYLKLYQRMFNEN